MKIKKLIVNSLLTLSTILALESVPAQKLEEKVENLNYNISCFTKIGDANFNYKQTGNKYFIDINAETNGLDISIFNRDYNFKIEGNVSNNNFKPSYYIFIDRNKLRSDDLIEVFQSFNFINKKVEAKKYNKNKEVYNKRNDITDETRDIMSALMELRTKPLQDEYTFQIVDKWRVKKFKVIKEGEKNIKINNINYKTNKFKIGGTNFWQEAFIYLDFNGNKALLKANIRTYGLGDIGIEIKK